MKIGIVTNSTFTIKNHYKYYKFLVDEYGHESLFFIITTYRKNNFVNNVSLIDKLERTKTVILNWENYINFCNNQLPDFDFLIVHSANHAIENLILFKYANKYNVKILDISFATDFFSQYKKPDWYIKYFKLGFDILTYFRFFKVLLFVLINDPRLFFFYLLHFSSHGPRYFTAPLPEEYRMTRHFMLFKEIAEHLTKFGYNMKDITVIGPYFKKLENQKNYDKRYILYVDSNHLAKFISLDYIVKLQEFYEKKGFVLLYAPHPSFDSLPHKKYRDIVKEKIHHILPAGVSTDYIQHAEIIISHGTSLSHVVLVNRKKLIYLYSAAFEKKVPHQVFEWQDTISRISNVPNYNTDEDMDFEKSMFNPENYTELLLDEYFNHFYGSPDIVNLDPQHTILDYIKTNKKNRL